MRRSCCSFLTAAVLLGIFAKDPLSARQTPAPRHAVIDVVAVDRDGRPVDDLGSRDFSVSVDGQPSRVISVTHVSRGAAAEGSAAARQANGGADAFAAEPSRVVLVVVDQTMLRRGDERTAIQATSAFLDRLGLDDRVAVVRLPMAATARLSTNTDRPTIREALAAVMGQLTQAPATAAEERARADNRDRTVAADPDRVTGGDPDKVTSAGERVQPEAPPDAPPAIPDDDLEKVRATTGGLANVLAALQPVPGRKTLVLFSAGFPSGSRSLTPQIEMLAASAAGARTVIHVLGLRSSNVEDRFAADFLPLDTLARKTGGTALILDKEAARTVDRVVQQLSSCYAIALDAPATVSDGRAHNVRVETTRKNVTLRVPAALVARPDPGEAVIADRSVADPSAAVPPSRPPERAESAREMDTEMAVSRMSAYVAGYQRAFSGLVAEEEYSQQISGRRARTRSDFLLVKVEPAADYWISFRDVFEVDGKPVRDREDRLKKLFLDNPAIEAVAQAQKIKDESARLNIGRVERNFNVPLFPLMLLLRDNSPRFHFRLADKTTSQGMPVWKIEFEERIRPTVIKNPRTQEDVPTKGYFLMDPVTGAVLETRLEAQAPTVTAHVVVRYRSDAALGLWVPAQMTEIYYTRIKQELILSGNATYTNFRRFQVKTEEKLTIPK